ncbi:MAG: hypothetical protein E7471_02470 [Ruminococcaceae bacterium]|nr:hypothetical protein [Oscillospiraceae bacterium]
MKLRKPSKTLLVTLGLIVFCVIYVAISSARSARLRVETIPSLPTTHPSDTQTQNPVSQIDFDRVLITPDNVISVIAEMHRPEHYYYETESELFAKDASVKYFHKVWRQDAWTRIDSLTSDLSVKLHTVYGLEKAFYWEPNARTYHTSAIGDISSDESQMLMSYENILELTPDEIVSAEFTTYENQGAIHVVANPSDSNHQTEYWISTEHGLLLAGIVKNDDTVFYSIKMSALNLAEQEDVVFSLPDGNLAMNL